MLTIGYGDITPTTNAEKIYIIVFAFIACGIFAYSINSVGIIVQEFSKKNKQFRRKMNNLQRYMKQRGLSFHL